LLYTRTILLAFIALQTNVFGQIGKSIYVTRDPRVDKLVDKHIELNKLTSLGRVVIEQGFRLLVISTNKRDLVMKVRADLLREFPNEKTYMSYQSPNFKVHFGNFSTRHEAEKAKKDLSETFGTSIIIVPSKIERVVNFNDKNIHQ
jgi:hypothetical protein